jgi:hypothetical protein
MAPNNKVPNLIIYDSSNAYQVLSAAAYQSRVPNAQLYDTAGIASATTTTWVLTLNATYYGSIAIMATVGTSTGNIASGAVTDLASNLIGAPYDVAVRSFNPAGTGSGSTFVQQPLNVWNSAYTYINPPQVIALMGGNSIYTLGSTATATSGTASTVVDSGATFGTATLANFSALGQYYGTADSVTTTTLTDTDSAPAWVTNALAGLYVYINASSTFGGGYAKIISNTTTVLTFAAITGLTGTPTYVIGNGNLKTIVTNRTSWVANAYAGLYAVCTAAADANTIGTTYLIKSNTATTMTLATPLPADSLYDTTLAFTIMSTSLQGSYVQITTGTNAGQTRLITGNIAKTIYVAPAYTAACDNTSVYQIVTYNNPSQALYEYYLPLVLNVYLKNFNAPEVTKSFSTVKAAYTALLHSNPQQHDAPANGYNQNFQQDLIYLNQLIALGKAQYDYENIINP